MAHPGENDLDVWVLLCELWSVLSSVQLGFCTDATNLEPLAFELLELRYDLAITRSLTRALRSCSSSNAERTCLSDWAITTCNNYKIIYARHSSSMPVRSPMYHFRGGNEGACVAQTQDAEKANLLKS
jgi:hypothetical protein